MLFLFKEKSMVSLFVPARRPQTPPGREAARSASRQGRLEKGGGEGTDLRSSDRWVGSRPPSSAHYPWCRQRWQRRAAGRVVTAQAAGCRPGIGDQGSGMRDPELQRTGCGCGAGVWGAARQPTDKGSEGCGGPVWKTHAQRGAGRVARSPASFWREPRERRRGAPGFSRAGSQRAAPLALTCSCATSSLLPGRELAAPAASGRQFRVSRAPAPRARETT